MAEQLALLPGYMTAHLQLALVALAVGSGVSIPIGIWVTRRPGLEGPLVGAASVIQTIPSLALLAIMVPAMAALGGALEATGIEVRGIGYTPALVALSLYSLLPILRNTVAGIRGVDPALVEAARGVGMTPGQQLLRVELPLAMPVIVAGLRTAAVWVVGTATLSTPVGATSLGNFIFSGLATRNDAAVLVGCVAAAALALLLDGLIRGLEISVQQRRVALGVAAGTGLLLLVAWAGAAFVLQRSGSDDRPVAIGSKAFTEQYILADLIAGSIARTSGTPTRLVPSLGSTVAFDALVAGDIDLYVDYSGTIFATLMKREASGSDRAGVLAEVTRYLADEHGVTLVAPLGFENTYALGMRSARARDLGVTRISDLTPLAHRLEIGADYEFFQRAEWQALERSYGLEFGSRRSMDPALMYQAVAGGEVDVISAFSTDGRIPAYDLVLLEDDRGVIPPYDAILLASPRLARERPGLIEELRGLSGAIDAAAMQRMNLAVDADGRSPAEVAREWLEQSARSAGRPLGRPAEP